MTDDDRQALIHGDFTTLTVERRGSALWVHLDRPDKLNAIDSVMLREVGDLFASFEHEHHARVIVLAGNGRSFCAGADRSPAPDPTRPDSARGKRWFANLGRRACRAIEDCPIPTIARVHGHAIGGGMCFAMACDFRITTDDALWWLPEVELGVPLTWAAIPRLNQEIGMARSRQLVMLCERIDGSTAAEWGVAHAAVGADDLDATVDSWIERIVGLPELAVHMTKTTFRGYGRLHSMGDTTEVDADLFSVAERDPTVAANFGRSD